MSRDNLVNSLVNGLESLYLILDKNFYLIYITKVYCLLLIVRVSILFIPYGNLLSLCNSFHLAIIMLLRHPSWVKSGCRSCWRIRKSVIRNFRLLWGFLYLKVLWSLSWIEIIKLRLCFQSGWTDLVSFSVVESLDFSKSRLVDVCSFLNFIIWIRSPSSLWIRVSLSLKRVESFNLRCL